MIFILIFLFHYLNSNTYINSEIELNTPHYCQQSRTQQEIKTKEHSTDEILWAHKRKLKISDFKQNTRNKPNLALTTSYIRSNSSTNPYTGIATIKVASYFDCKLSYFKRSDTDHLTLEHEQLHFDITEIYARKYIKTVQTSIKNHDQFMEQYEFLFDSIFQELQDKQIEYDTEVYADRSTQSKWVKWVNEQLLFYADYDMDQFEMPNN